MPRSATVGQKRAEDHDGPGFAAAPAAGLSRSSAGVRLAAADLVPHRPVEAPYIACKARPRVVDPLRIGRARPMERAGEALQRL